jgi:hypothetical protein
MTVWVGLCTHIPDIIRFNPGRIDSKEYETICTMYHATSHEAQQSVAVVILIS